MRIWSHGFDPKYPCVYIMASALNGVLYTGITSNLAERVSAHKQDMFDGFTKKYRVHRLVYYEMHETLEAAILRESRVKKWRRAWKVRLILEMNPEWCDLFDENWGSVEDGPDDAARKRW